MINILFFARLREQLDCAKLELEWSDELACIQDLRAHLQTRSPVWADALGAQNILVAVNQQQADPAQVVNPGDEVAFFPPVTGG